VKKWLKVVLVCTAVVIVLAGAAAGYFFSCMYPYRGTVNNSGFEECLTLDTVLTQEQAIEDLSYMMELLESRHPAWLEEDSDIPAKTQAQFDKEIAVIGEEVTVLELWQAASRITSVMHDGHTWVRYSGIELYVDDITQFTDSENTIISIDGEPSGEVYKRFLELFQYELEPYARAVFSSVIIREKYLSLMGVDTSDGVTFTFEKNEEQTEYHYNFVPADEIKGNDTSAEEKAWVDYEIDAENDAAVFILKECNYNDEYCAKLREFFEEVEKNSIGNVIVDLRGNGGGNSMVANEFLRYVDIDGYKCWDSDVRYGSYVVHNRDVWQKNDRADISFAGSIYVLTDVDTYSSAMDFAMLIGDNDIGLLIGEASGNRPDAYGDCLFFSMPNSKLEVSISSKRWYRLDQSKAWQPLEPDVPIEPEYALEKAYELIKNN